MKLHVTESFTDKSNFHELQDCGHKYIFNFMLRLLVHKYGDLESDVLQIRLLCKYRIE